MSKLDWSRAETKRVWAYTPTKPQSASSRAKQRIAICKADLDQAVRRKRPPADIAVKRRRLKDAIAQLSK